MAPRNSNDENPRRARLGPSESLRSLGAAGGIFLTLPFHVPPLRIMFLMFGRRGGFCWEKADFRARRAEKVHDSSRIAPALLRRPAAAAADLTLSRHALNARRMVPLRFPPQVRRAFYLEDM